MKNCISRRSFLKAAGMLGAAGALAACGGSSSSTAPASSAASSAASAAATGANIKLWTYPIGGWGNDDTAFTVRRPAGRLYLSVPGQGVCQCPDRQHRAAEFQHHGWPVG